MITREEFQTKLAQVEEAKAAFNDGALYAYDQVESGSEDTLEDYIAREFNAEADAEDVAEFKNGVRFAESVLIEGLPLTNAELLPQDEDQGEVPELNLELA